MEKIKKIIPVMVLLVSIFFVFGQNSKAEATDIYVGTYDDGSKAYLMTETIRELKKDESIYNCTVKAVYNNSEIINKTFFKS